MISALHSDQCCSVTTVTTVEGACLPSFTEPVTALVSFDACCNDANVAVSGRSDLAIPVKQSVRDIAENRLPSFVYIQELKGESCFDKFRAVVRDSDEDNKLTELCSISYKGDDSNSTVGALSYGAATIPGFPDLSLYSNPTTAQETYDSSDNLFDDAFSLDEFVRSGEGRMYHGNARPWDEEGGSQFQGYQGYTPQNHLRQIEGCNGLEHDAEQDLFQTIMNGQQNQMSRNHIQNFNNDNLSDPQPFIREIRSRTFSDLLKSDLPGMAQYSASNFIPCSATTGRTRDYSISSDSGLGSSVLESTSSPPNRPHLTSTISGGAPKLLRAESTGPAITTKSERFSPNVSNTSIKDEESNTDFPLGKLSSSHEGAVQYSDEKVSSKKTAYNEKWGVKVLKAWCIEMSVCEDFEPLTPEKLNDLLRRFWSEVRKSNGDYYGRNSLFNLRAMINKHLKGKPYCADFDIVTDERFRSSNDALEKQLKILKGIGKTISHKQPISIADLRRMYDSKVLGTENPLALLRKVWFEITLHFYHKGSEAQEKLTRASFQIYRDHHYRAYISKTRDGKYGNDTDEIRMYETGGDLCPVQSFQTYLQKLHPLQGRLFQQPRRKSKPSSTMWYGKAPIGEKALQQMMANISVGANLSKRYTNHCVRTTALDQFGTSRKKSGIKNGGDKLTNRCRSSNSSRYTNPPGYQARPANSISHQHMYYNHPAQLPVPCYSQTRLPSPSQPYDMSAYDNLNGALPNPEYNGNRVPPSPIKRHVVEESIAGHAPHYYKRTSSHAFPERAYGHASPDLQPPPHYPQQLAKKARLQNCRASLCRHAPMHNDWKPVYNHYRNAQTNEHAEFASNTTHLITPGEEFSESIVAGNGIPEMIAIPKDNFQMLANAV